LILKLKTITITLLTINNNHGGDNLNRNQIESIVDRGIRSFEKSMSSKLVNDIEKTLNDTPDIKRDIHGLVITLFRLKQKYDKEFSEYLAKWNENPIETDLLVKSRFSEASRAFIPEVIASETLEQIHKEYWFEEIYAKDTYYPNIFPFMEDVQKMAIDPGYYFRFYTNYPEKSKIFYLFVDQKVQFEEIVFFVLRLMSQNECALECDVIPLDYIPIEDEDYMYLRISDRTTNLEKREGEKN
jgi:hypothetical protein